jgi:DNA-binding CsgD family transcriptional regulator
MYEQLRALVRSQGDAELSGVLFYSTFHELISEDWEQAARYADESYEVALESERDAAVAFGHLARAIVAAHRGDGTEVRSNAVAATAIGAAIGMPPLVVLAGWALALVELSLGDAVAALPDLRAATDYHRASGTGEPNLLFSFPLHVEAAVATGALEEASELLDVVEASGRRLDRAWSLACAARGRALLAAARGDDAAADEAFARAYLQHERRPQQWRRFELARTLLAHGAVLRRRRQKRDARELLERALAIFEELGAGLWAERTRSELARIGGRALAVGGELTEMERRIAVLVREGRSNKEIAAALQLSPKTVEWNLSKVYAKLGVHSRTELAALPGMAVRRRESRGFLRLFARPHARSVGSSTSKGETPCRTGS